MPISIICNGKVHSARRMEWARETAQWLANVTNTVAVIPGGAEWEDEEFHPQN